MPCTDCQSFENSPVYIHQAQQPFCEQCGGDNKCAEKLDLKCAVYHLDNLEPTKLTRLGMPNGSNAEQIFEAIDDLIGAGGGKPIVPESSESVLLVASGASDHNLRGEVILSPDAGNILQIRSNGVYVSSPQDGKVKVDVNDAPAYLEDQVVGGTDGIVSISTIKDVGQIQFQPSLDIEQLLTIIRDNPVYVNLICQIIARCSCEAPSNVEAQMV